MSGNEKKWYETNGNERKWWDMKGNEVNEWKRSEKRRELNRKWIEMTGNDWRLGKQKDVKRKEKKWKELKGNRNKYAEINWAKREWVGNAGNGMEWKEGNKRKWIEWKCNEMKSKDIKGN